MIRLTEIIKGDKAENFQKVLDDVIDKTFGYTDGPFTFTSVDYEQPTQGEIDGERFVSECVLNIKATTTKIYPEMVGDLYISLARKIQSLGYGEYPFKFRLTDFIGKFGVDIWIKSEIPHNYAQHLRYDLPTIQQILLSEYYLVIPEDVLPKVNPNIEEWVKIKVKRALTYFEVYKKGKVEGHEYEIRLAENEPYTVRGKGKNIEDPKDLEVYLFPKIVSVDGVPLINIKLNLLNEIENLIKEKFERHSIKVMWF
jgi:hypothetical protein